MTDSDLIAKVAPLMEWTAHRIRHESRDYYVDKRGALMTGNGDLTAAGLLAIEERLCIEHDAAIWHGFRDWFIEVRGKFDWIKAHDPSRSIAAMRALIAVEGEK